MCPVVYVDSREYRKAQEVIKELRRLGATVVEKMLEIGDYVVSDRTVIERKTSRDFAKSIIDGRLFEQAKKLKENYEKPIIIIEGNIWNVTKYLNININCILGALTSLISKFNISTLFSKDKKTTAYYIYEIAKMEQEQEKRGLKTQQAKKNLTVRELQIQLLSSLPGIGYKRAEKILEEFETPLNALNNVKLWSKVGVPENTIYIVRKVLTTPFRESRSITVERQVKIDEVVREVSNSQIQNSQDFKIGILRYFSENSKDGKDKGDIEREDT